MQVAMIMLKSHMETSVRIIVATVAMGHQFPLMFHSSAPEQLWRLNFTRTSGQRPQDFLQLFAVE